MKKRGIIMASLCTFSLCAQPAQTPEPSRQGEVLSDTYPAAYNAPAAIAVSHKVDGMWVEDWTFFVDAAFTYWYVAEEGLRIATNGVLPGATMLRANNAIGYYPNFNYQPGFKVGIGIVSDDAWEYRADYFWVHSNVNGNGLGAANVTSASMNNSGASLSGTPVYSIDDWFLGAPVTGTTTSLAATVLDANWNMTLNVVDLTGGRPFYQAKTITITPQGGLELEFLSQSMTVNLTEASAQVTAGFPAQPITSTTTAKSWGIGPTAGCKAMHLLPWDFYVEGGGAFSLLYTTYTTLSHTEDQAATTYNGNILYSYNSNYHAMRPVAKMDMGLGWGRYLDSNACYLDISATYEFSIYWAQNMLRKLMDDFASVGGNRSGPPADLFTQGLTITASISF